MALEHAIQKLEERLLQGPVSFEEFIKSEEYCGNSEFLQWWIDELSPCKDKNEIIINGSLGSGKTYSMAHYLCYRFYCLLIEGSMNIQKSMGLAEKSPLYIPFFSTTLTTAQRSGFQYLYNVFKANAWFKEHCPIDENVTTEIRLYKAHTVIYHASSFAHQLSLNIPMFILDESNFRKGVGQGMVEEYREVEEIYTQLLDRQLSRFATPTGSKSCAFLISSASYQSSFLERRIKEVKGNQFTQLVNAVQYRIKPENYSKEYFLVFTGGSTLDPRILENKEEGELLLQKAKIPIEDFDHYIEKVPLSLKKQYEHNLVRSLQNHSGIAVQVEGRFLKDLKYLVTSYTCTEELVLRKDKIEASTGDDTRLIDNVIIENLVFVERPHALYLDASLSGDSAGLVLTRYDGEVDNRKKFTQVFALEILPPEFPYRTELAKIRDFVYDLSEYLYIAAFGSDQYQSEMLRQEITRNLRLKNIRLSLDSSDIPYLHWLSCLIDKAYNKRYHDTLEREAQEAEHDYRRHRVVKRKDSSDNMLQADVGSFFLCSTEAIQSYEAVDTGEDLNFIGGLPYEKALSRMGYTAYN
jgi:hypothetical protein